MSRGQLITAANLYRVAVAIIPKLCENSLSSNRTLATLLTISIVHKWSIADNIQTQNVPSLLLFWPQHTYTFSNVLPCQKGNQEKEVDLS